MMFMKKSCVEFERKKQHNISFPTFKLPSSTKKTFMTDPLNNVFDDFSI